MDICCWGGGYYWFIRVGSRVMCVFYLLSFSSLVLLISVSCHYSLSNLCVFAQFVSFTIQNYGYIRDSQNATILASLSLRFHSVFFFVYAFISHYTITNREVQNPIKHFCSATTAQHRLKQFSAVEIVNPSNAIPIFWRVKVKQTSLPEGCRRDESKSCRSAKRVTTVTHAQAEPIKPFCTRSLWLRSHFVTVYGVSGPEPFNLLQWVSDGAACKWICSKD
jgi:hypothetical protein